jgi:DNA-binding GntR family transcriptional regulator
MIYYLCMAAVDPRSGAPLYHQVETALLERIRRDYRPGQLLPTQEELAREFGTSLITVKRALSEIGRKGYLRSTRGRGTVVLRPVVEDDRRGVASWTDSMTGMGRTPRTVESSVSLRAPSREVARELGLRSRAKIVLLERLRTLDGVPFCVMRNELPFELAPELADGLPEESLYGWLKAVHGLVPHRADEEVVARGPLPREARFLGPAAKTVISVRRQTFLGDGTPLEIAEMVAPAHLYRYRVEIVRTS